MAAAMHMPASVERNRSPIVRRKSGSPKRQLRIAAFVTAMAAIVTRPSGHGESVRNQ